MLSNSSRRPSIRMSSQQHRVLIYCVCYRIIDGVTLTIRKLEQEILAAGHHLCILSTLSGDPANTHLNGTHPNRRVVFLDNAVPVPFVHDPKNPELTYQIGFRLSASVREELEAFGPTIFHLTTPDCTALHLIQYARDKEIPVMGTYHSNFPEYVEHYAGFSWLKHVLGAFFRHQYNFMQALYVPTPFIQRHLIDNYSMDRVTELKFWGRGVDIDKFNPAHRSLKYRRSLGIRDNIVVVCLVGRLVPEKRVDIFCNTVRRLKAYGIPFHALVVGTGSEEEEVRSLPNTTLAGWMKEDELAVVYASSDIFLFPSSVETFGNVTLEAAASGLPVVVAKGCSGHLVRDGVNGFACEAGDKDAFFNATLRLVEDEKLRRQCSENGRHLSLTMEKRAVVSKMLHNYSTITEEFFTEYGGHHKCRDDIYRKPDTFRLGDHPRPILLVIVEKLFILLFQALWKVNQLFAYIQNCNLSTNKDIVSKPRQGSPHLGKATFDAFPAKRVASNSLEPSVSFSAPSLSCSLIHDSSTLFARDNGFTEVGVGLLQQAGSDCDDATESTADSTDAECTDIRARKNKAFGDSQLCHSLVRAFLRVLMFQMRMESRIRNSCATFFCAWRAFRHGSKRKSDNCDIFIMETKASGCNRSKRKSDNCDDIIMEAKGSGLKMDPIHIPQSVRSGSCR